MSKHIWFQFLSYSRARLDQKVYDDTYINHLDEMLVITLHLLHEDVCNQHIDQHICSSQLSIENLFSPQYGPSNHLVTRLLSSANSLNFIFTVNLKVQHMSPHKCMKCMMLAVSRSVNYLTRNQYAFSAMTIIKRNINFNTQRVNIK